MWMSQRPHSRGFFGIQFRIANDGANCRMGLSAPAQVRASGRHAVHAGSQHRPQLANLQRAGLHRRGRYPERCLVPPAPGGGGRAGKALCQGHGQARARDERSEERRSERPGGPGSPDGRDLLLEFRNSDHARCGLGAAPAADAAGHPDQVEPVACRTMRSHAIWSVRSRPSESDAIRWQDVEAEPPGFVVLYRYREAPHPRVSFATTFRSAWNPSRE